jgi:pimeloyl-ACP methyl ester carboxylesterase
MPTIEHRGARIGYAEAGSRETVLLLHSSASSAAQWRSLAEMLQAGCHVLAPDLYGYGETGPWRGDAPLRLADEVALAEAVLPRSHGPVHLVGHSYGGAVALRFAVERPERLQSLTLIEPVAFHLLRDAPRDSADRALFREVAAIATCLAIAAARGDEASGMAEFVDYWNGVGAWTQMKPEQRAALACRAAKVTLDFEATMAEPTPIAALRRIDIPTLVLRGSASPLPTRRIAELLAEALPNARLRTIEGAGHMLPLTHREAVNAAIAEHLFCSPAGRQRPAAA